MARTVQGKTYTWQLSDSPIGSGDAGEVYAAACVDQPDLTGVIKKPARIATAGTIQRQAGQIAQEALALKILAGLPEGKAHPPRLLDLAHDYTQGTANYFIVSETAPGENIADMLINTHQKGKPFPRRVIVTVLDALFDLFSRAHKAGVLWNDIKLEHIYWHNPTGQIAVIDWGNAQFLENPIEGQQRSLPRWQDYQQMVDSLGGFLQRSAPELYTDLGWDEFQGQSLDAPRISILARRIAYQQQVISLKVMEYQSLIKVVLSADPTLEGLQQIKQYRSVLEQIGATWAQDAVLNYGQTLVEDFLKQNNSQNAIQVTALVWEIFGEALNLSWHLIREYFRDPDILKHQALSQLVQHTFSNNWSSALWTIVLMARDIGHPTWWDQLMPVLRQKALGLTTPPPYQTCETLLDWIEAQSPKKAEHAQTVSDALLGWRSKGNDFKESPFNYVFIDLLREETDIPHRLRMEANQNFAAGREAIRELVQCWSKADWDSFPKAFRRVIGWDPDRWGIIRLAQRVEDFQNWKQALYLGPDSNIDVDGFIRSMVLERPQVEQIMGKPIWFNKLNNLLNALQNGDAASDDHETIQHWCPWLLKHLSNQPSGQQKAS